MPGKSGRVSSARACMRATGTNLGNTTRLAQTSVTPQGRNHFAKLARTWIRLAEDLEKNQGSHAWGRADGTSPRYAPAPVPPFNSIVA
jgi:hypothetical protein